MLDWSDITWDCMDGFGVEYWVLLTFDGKL